VAEQGNRRGSREAAAERRVQALELRKAGASYRQIGKTLGTSQVQAYRDVQRMLQALAKVETDKARELRSLEDERLNDLLLVLWPQAKKGNLGAIDRIVRIMERRARLFGLDAPTKVAETTPEGMALPPEQVSLRIVRLLEMAQARKDVIEE